MSAQPITVARHAYEYRCIVQRMRQISAIFCSYMTCMLKRLRDQGLNDRQLDIVFQANVVSRILYALPGWGPFLSKEERINAFLKRAFRYGFATKILEVNSLLDSVSKDLFCNMQRSYHCLFSILPVETPHDHKLRERGHNLVLPRCQNNIYKISFLNKCLFSIV